VNSGDLFLCVGESCGRLGDAFAQRLGVLDLFTGVRWLAGQVPFTLRDRPVDLRLAPLGVSRRTSQRCFAPVEAIAAG
jgi:hypothetical protein